MGIVAINKQQTVMPICLVFGVPIKFFDPFNANDPIGPTLFQITKAVEQVSI